MANSTPIRATAHPKPAMVHFEITVESLRRRRGHVEPEVRHRDRGRAHRRGDRRQPASRSEPESPTPTPTRTGIHLHPSVPLGQPRDNRFESLADSKGSGGAFDADGRPAAFAPVNAGPLQSQPLDRRGRVAKRAGRLVGRASAYRRSPSCSAALVLLGIAVTTLRSSQRELREAALRDSLTGMRNRRSLMADLERGHRQCDARAPLLLALFDLDGFKAYNDAFGHPAGDALLARAGPQPLGGGQGPRAGLPHGRRRVLHPRTSWGQTGTRPLLGAAISRAVASTATAFTVTATYGAVLLPSETTDVSEAMRVADQRMYANKGDGPRVSRAAEHQRAAHRAGRA